MLLVAIALTVLFVGATTLLLRVRIITPLLGLAATMQRLRSTQDLTIRVKANGQDEFGKVAVAVNELIASLQSAMHSVKGRTNDLLKIAGSLSGAAGQIEEGGRAQNEAATSTASAVQRLAVSEVHVAENANTAPGWLRPRSIPPPQAKKWNRPRRRGFAPSRRTLAYRHRLHNPSPNDPEILAASCSSSRTWPSRPIFWH